MAEERLYLDFSSNSEINEERNRDRLYKVGLKDQFNGLPVDVEYENYVRNVLPRSDITVGISFPNFDRKPPSETEPNRWLNIAVRIPLDENDSDIVLMCDIDEYTPKNKPKLRFLKVKGFTLLDRNAVSCGEIQKYCDIFTRLYFGEDWYNLDHEDNKYLSDYEINSSLLSIDFLKELSQTYVVKAPQKVLGRLSKWDLYLRSREEIMNKSIDSSYSVDDYELQIAYFKTECPEELRENPIEHLIFKDKSVFWSSKETAGSEPVPLIRISHDFLKKDCESDPNLRKKFEMFIGGRSLLLSEQVVIEKKQYKNGTVEEIPRFGSKVELVDSLVSSVPDVEEIQNISKINSLIDDNKKKIAKIKEENSLDCSKEKKSLLKYYEEHELVQEIDKYHEDLYQRYIPECTAMRSSIIDTETKRLDVEIKKTEITLAEKKNEIDNLREQMKAENQSDKDKKSNGKTDKASNSIKKKIDDSTQEMIKLDDELRSLMQEKEDLEEAYPLDSLIEDTIRPFVDSKRSQLLDERTAIIAAEIDPKYEKLLKTKISTQNEDTDKAIEKVRIEETRLRFHIFYRLDSESFSTPESIIENISERISGKSLFVYKDPSGDRAVIKRQRQALDNLRRGYVMNPYLATALFNSSDQRTHSESTVDFFYSRKLNDRQKEAIRKAVSSNGMFLIRGPPGTGKTEVIAEITAQLVSKGKKVMIASENHKAVDNAFQRLPEIPSLRRLRLFGGFAMKKGEKNPYSDKFLTANFYHDVAKCLEQEIRKTSSSRQYAENLDSIVKDLSERDSKVELLKVEAQKILDEIDDLVDENKRISEKIANDLDENKDFESKISELKEEIRCIDMVDRDNFDRLTASIRVEYDGSELPPETVRVLYAMSKPAIKKEYLTIEQHQAFFDLFYQKAHAGIKEARQIEMQIMEYQRDSNINAFEFNMVKLFPDGIPSLEAVLQLKESIYRQVQVIKDDKEKEISKIRSLCNDTRRLEQTLRNNERELDSLRDDPIFKAYDDARESLDTDIRKVLNDNNISGSFKDAEEGIDFIKQEKRRINKAAKDGLSSELMDAYKKMADYLCDESVIESDSENLNERMLDYVNVIGLTCTTGDNITTDSGNVDIKRANIDVVIVDEVSKVSFLEVLYPILYGKTVILVGDDKQLPPTYQSNVSDDFERYDPALVNPDLEKEFKHMYESSFFRELYESIPECNKIMLTKQYRMHPDIMDADNIFYGNQLTFGGDMANKEHYLDIKGSSGRRIIGRNSHLMFIDVDANEEDRNNSSTSRSNQREADVVINILQKLQHSCRKDRFGEEIGGRKFTKDDDTRLSLGVICGYSDQARMIRRRLRGFKFESFNRREDEQFMVDTVDNFQGDERDIIILSLTATRRLDRSFMKVFNRINVAISRARCLLIIVGNARGFSNVRTDLDGKTEYVYRKIVNEAKYHNGYFTEKDVMGE